MIYKILKTPIGAAILIILILPNIASAQTSTAFSDVPETSKFFIPVSYLQEHQLIKGYSDDTFQPENPVNRAEALAIILTATGHSVESFADQTENITPENPLQIILPKTTDIVIQNLKTGEKKNVGKVKTLQIETGSGNAATLKISQPVSKKPFSDVYEKDWFFNVVTQGKKMGIVKGYNNGKYFKPKNKINLAEVLRMLFQAAGTDTNSAAGELPPGISSDAWYSKDISYAINHHILLQMENGNIFPPGKELNRGEIATLIYRFLRDKENISFGYASWYGDGLAKTKLTEGMEYKEKNLTAAHLSFPFGTILRVTNMLNGKQTNVVVNDRGPFVKGRIIDLSKTAFSALESPSAGIIPVQVEVVK